MDSNIQETFIDILDSDANCSIDGSNSTPVNPPRSLSYSSTSPSSFQSPLNIKSSSATSPVQLVGQRSKHRSSLSFWSKSAWKFLTSATYTSDTPTVNNRRPYSTPSNSNLSLDTRIQNTQANNPVLRKPSNTSQILSGLLVSPTCDTNETDYKRIWDSDDFAPSHLTGNDECPYDFESDLYELTTTLHVFPNVSVESTDSPSPEHIKKSRLNKVKLSQFVVYSKGDNNLSRSGGNTPDKATRCEGNGERSRNGSVSAIEKRVKKTLENVASMVDEQISYSAAVTRNNETSACRSSLKLKQLFPHDSLPPALRNSGDWSRDSGSFNDDFNERDSSHEVVDFFGFVLNTPWTAEYSLLELNFRRMQLRKNKIWFKFKCECERYTSMELALENSGLGISSWGLAGDRGKALQAKFDELVVMGLPVKVRWEVWLDASGSSNLISAGDLESYSHRWRTELSESVVNDIEFDLRRTLTKKNIFFKDERGIGRERLHSLLVSYATRNSNTGYCQGMHKIAAYLILICPTASTAFGLFCALIENKMPEGYWANDLAMARNDQTTLQRTVEKCLPELGNHFDYYMVHLEPFTMRWFISLFTDGMGKTTAEFVYRVWDVLLCRGYPEGYKFLFLVGISILREHMEALLAMKSAADIHRLLDQGMEVRADRVGSIIRRAFRYYLQFGHILESRMSALHFKAASTTTLVTHSNTFADKESGQAFAENSLSTRKSFESISVGSSLNAASSSEEFSSQTIFYFSSNEDNKHDQ